jgi:hypothetical protein
VSVAETVIIAAFLGIPLMTLAHELGHAAAALHYTKGRVGIRVGSAQGVMKIHLGRLLIGFSIFGSGGFCRPGERVSRGKRLIIVLAGPAMSAIVAAVLYAAGAGATGNARAALWTIAFISGLYAVLNMIPRRAAWNPITKGIPSDGLQAWCLIRDKPIPPADPTKRQKGMRDSLNGREVVTVILMNIVGLGVGIGLAAGKLGGVGTAFYAAMLLQLALSGSGRRAPATGAQKPHPAGNPRTGGPGAARRTGNQTSAVRVPANQLAIPLNGALRRTAPTATPAVLTTKTCPQCGAEVQRRASLCYCLHQFNQATTATG